MRRIAHDKPFYQDDLYQRYLSAQSVELLSTEEQDWLRQHGAIRIGFLNHDTGISTFDIQTGDIYRCSHGLCRICDELSGG